MPGDMRRKDAQLCHQAVEALGLALATSADAVLREVIVACAEPWPDLGRLRVSVYGDAATDAGALLERLERARGYLRAELAGAIHRKRTPELIFHVLPASAAGAPPGAADPV